MTRLRMLPRTPHTARVFGSTLVYFNQRVLVCAEVRQEALSRIRGARRG